MEQQEQRFYLKVSGRPGPRRSHPTLASAYAEAKRLHDLNGGAIRVRVLQQIGTLEPTREAVPA